MQSWFNARLKKVNMKTLEKWNPFRVSPSWDPIRELEEMQGRLGFPVRQANAAPGR